MRLTSAHILGLAVLSVRCAYWHAVVGDGRRISPASELPRPKEIWRLPLAGLPDRALGHEQATAFVAHEGSHLVVGPLIAGMFVGIDATTGRERWRTRVAEAGWWPTIAGRRVFVKLIHGFAVLDDGDGHPLWQRSDCEFERATQRLALASCAVNDGQPLVVRVGRPPLAPHPQRLLALEIETGKEIWHRDLIVITPHFANDDQRLYVTDLRRPILDFGVGTVIRSLALDDGRDLWRTEIASTALWSSVHGQIVWLSGEGDHALRTDTGRSMWSRVPTRLDEKIFCVHHAIRPDQPATFAGLIVGRVSAGIGGLDLQTGSIARRWNLPRLLWADGTAASVRFILSSPGLMIAAVPTDHGGIESNPLGVWEGEQTRFVQSPAREDQVATLAGDLIIAFQSGDIVAWSVRRLDPPEVSLPPAERVRAMLARGHALRTG